ncbi:kinase response regulator receiver domain-containing protein [Fomitopsis serialis]|uniref:kinase response regulator receiver domain-containing protein n=1 Tax=Fomitopsis serialis TaxID=139415 RepID=UPI0020087BA7|nr:kinase response regulator receiver domain-containing protein [Neoantrodia serialis]KAH9938258.1 kinase response regulator receiver domain-containing protein [Neoantrodia serialis]
MPFVRRHVTRRLKAAKAECDKELQRTTNSITAFFEERLREGDHEAEFEREQRERERGPTRESNLTDSQPEPLREAFVLQPAELRSALQFDDVSSDGGYEADPEGNYHSRQRACLDEDPATQHSLIFGPPSPGLLTASVSSTSPASLRRHSTLPRGRSVTNVASSSTGASSPALSSVTSPTPPPEVVSPRKQSAAAQSRDWSAQTLANRRLSRTIHIPVRTPRSGASSRSASRSRSPLPRGYQDQATNNRRSSRILVDDPVDPIMTTLYELIGIATDVQEMSINQLTANPKVCEQLVQRVQNIGKAWDEHPDWHGRNWYVQVLLAIASLSRVVEWWEAEKQFWNFDDNDDEQDEALTFVLRPADEEEGVAPTPSVRAEAAGTGALRFQQDEESKLRMSRTVSQTRRTRDETPKDLSMTPAKENDQPRSTSKFTDNNESARVLATERLRLQAEHAQNQNIVLELSMDGDHFIWVNYAWRNVIGTDQEDLIGTRISRLLAPADWHVFRDATRRLLDDDSRIVEVRFRLKVIDAEPGQSSYKNLYQQMVGTGMLMMEREEGTPTHTMWVVRPIGQPECLEQPPSILLESGEVGDEPASAEATQVGFGHRQAYEPVTPFPFARPINIAPILCRICECEVPQWYFEKHNETCAETHRLEAEISECNESIGELRNTIRDLLTAIDRSSPMTAPEYRGMPIFSPATSPGSSSPLQLLRAPLKMKKLSVKKLQRHILEQLEDILQLCSEISIPALKDEESAEPIERQRLLSPASERKMSQVRRWGKPSIEDGALTQLIEDAERVMRQKVDNVVRMQNTIKYSEKIRQEWADKVAQTLSQMEDVAEEDEDEDEDGEQTAEGSEDEQQGEQAEDRTTNTIDYAFGSQTAEPTPIAATSPIPFSGGHSGQTIDHTLASNFSSPLLPVAPIPAYPPSNLQTRSSTPSSISSPLALAAPTVSFATYPAHDLTPPPMDLNEVNQNTVRPRPSLGILEPRLLITPPLSPLVSPEDQSQTRRPRRRRHSTAAQPILSPTNSVSGTPLSPRLPSVAPLSRTTPTSIKDFEIIKPISKGAFGSVFLAKKKATGDYFAIKVLKKADMIAKNQITNVKAERMILMKQAESPFVAKLYFTFQSKENLYLVMEYLNGGDCAALIKSLGSLPEEWTRNYIAEVVLGLEYLHQRGIVHRDLKPDNLLIDQHGHLKLTDFGLSRIGLLGRQTRDAQLPFGMRTRSRHSPGSRPPSIDSVYIGSTPFTSDLYAGGSYFTQRTSSIPRLGSSPYLSLSDDVSESSGSESLQGSGLFAMRRSNSKQQPHMDSPLQSFATELTTDLRSHPNPGGTPPGDQKVVGTPDYLAPETILGLRGDDAAVDWWALGVITYEFLYGIPPFHDETPEKVFENILSGRVQWHEGYMDISPEAKDFMQRLMTQDPSRRLGANGADEVKDHPFFAGIDWDKVTATEAAFIPQVTDPESTDYFDPRGAVLQPFSEPDHPTMTTTLGSDSPAPSADLDPASASAPPALADTTAMSPSDDDFGSFSFKNLPVLKQANDDMIRKMKTDQMAPLSQTLSEPANLHTRRKSVSAKVNIKKPTSVTIATDGPSKPSPTNPPSPATSTSSIASSMSRGPPTPGSASGHVRKPSDYSTVERFKLNHLEGDNVRRNSMPSRLRTASVSTNGESVTSDSWGLPPATGPNHYELNTPPSSVASVDLKRAPDPSDRAVTCLLAEDNPITAKIIETLLIRLGCRCVVVADGSEAISVAMGDIKFDCILMDLHMPILDGEGAARYIKNSGNKNAEIPIIAVSAYSATASDVVDPSLNLFAAYLSKPVQKTDLLATMRQLGFKTSTVQGQGRGQAAKLTPAR